MGINQFMTLSLNSGSLSWFCFDATKAEQTLAPCAVVANPHCSHLNHHNWQGRDSRRHLSGSAEQS